MKEFRIKYSVFGTLAFLKILTISPSIFAGKAVFCASVFSARSFQVANPQYQTLQAADGVVSRSAYPSFLAKLEKNREPSIRYFSDPSKYIAPNIQIFDNRRLYEPSEMLRFKGARLIKMYRGLAIEEGQSLKLVSPKEGSPIWITPDYEHARLYAAEWTPVDNWQTTKAIILEMWVPEFLIYWRNDPRVEGMAEAFIFDKDVRTLESYITKIHTVKSPKREVEDASAGLTFRNNPINDWQDPFGDW